jgi:hypothetical protein
MIRRGAQVLHLRIIDSTLHSLVQKILHCAIHIILTTLQASRSQGAFLYGDLWNDGLPKDTLSWNVRVSDLGSNPSRPVVLGKDYDIAVIADGGWSELRARYFRGSVVVARADSNSGESRALSASKLRFIRAFTRRSAWVSEQAYTAAQLKSRVSGIIATTSQSYHGRRLPKRATLDERQRIELFCCARPELLHIPLLKCQ